MTMAHRKAGHQRRTRSARSRVMMRVPVLLDDESIVEVRPVESSLDRAAIDEERWRRRDTHARPRLHVHPDARPRRRVIEAGPESRDVEVELARVAEEALALEVIVILEEEVVVLPEPILLRGALCGDGGEASVGVNRARDVTVAARVEGEVAEDEADVGVIAKEIPQIPESPYAVRTLEVGEGHDREPGFRRPLRVRGPLSQLRHRADGEPRVPRIEARGPLANLRDRDERLGCPHC